MTERRMSRITVSTPGYYSVVVAGEIDPSWVDHFAGMSLEAGTPGETRLAGYLVDQAALQGILERLHGLSIPILSVVRVDDGNFPDRAPSNSIRAMDEDHIDE